MGSGSSSKSSRKGANSSKDDIKNMWEENPDVYGIRRSGRERKQTDRMQIEKSEEKPKKRGSRRRSSANWHSSDLSEHSDSDGDSPKKKRPTSKKPPPPKKKKKNIRKGSSSEDSDSDAQPRHSSRGNKVS